MYMLPRGVKVSLIRFGSKPGRSTEGLARVSLDGGHDVVGLQMERGCFWFLGEFVKASSSRHIKT